MGNEEKDANKAIMILAAACLIIFLMLANSCRSVQVVTEYRDRIVHDTTATVDSVYIDRFHTITQKGDTVYKTDSIFLNRYKFIEKVTIEQVHDSIPYPVEVVKEKKVTSQFAKFCISFFVFFMGFASVLGAWYCYRLLR